MSILLLDTSTDHAVLALCSAADARSVQSSLVFEGRRTLSRKLLSRIDALLRSEGAGLKDLTGVAVGLGPGSFTGLRVGVTTAKTLAMALDIPLYGVETFHAYAAAGDDRGATLVVSASRRNEVYAQFFHSGMPDGPAFTISPDALAQRCASLAAGDDLHVIGAGEAIAALPGIKTRLGWPPAEGMASAAAARIAAGPPDDHRVLVPVYVAQPIITTPKDASVLSNAAARRSSQP